MNGNKFLQTSHLPKAEHRPFSSSKWQVRILSPVVLPAARLLLGRIANDLHRCAIGTKFIRHDHFWIATAFHRFSYEFQRCFTIPAPCDVALQLLTFVINGPPKVMCNSINLHKNLIQMPLPVRVSSHPGRPIATDFRSKHRAKYVSPEPNRLVADVDPALVQEIFHIPQR
jgi:hypothetical protein